MGLSLLNPLPDLRQENADLLRAVERLTREISDVRQELQRERLKNSTIERGVQKLREVLGPLYNGLQMIHGEIDAMGLEDSTPKTAPKSAIWEDWKQKLGGKPAEAIDVLHLHGEMNAVQLRLHLHCGNDYIYNVISKLNKAGLINKNGGRISLKEL